MTVLIIDDDKEDTSVFCEALIELYPKAKCLVANSCEKILETVNEIDPDLIFMDGQMNPISGMQCLKLLNDYLQKGNKRIIIHSGSLSPHEVDEFKAAGINDILLKVGSYKELQVNIASIVNKYKLEPISDADQSI